MIYVETLTENNTGQTTAKSTMKINIAISNTLTISRNPYPKIQEYKNKRSIAPYRILISLNSSATMDSSSLLQRCIDPPPRSNAQIWSSMSSQTLRFCCRLEEKTHTKLSPFLLPFSHIFFLVFRLLSLPQWGLIYRQLSFQILFGILSPKRNRTQTHSLVQVAWELQPLLGVGGQHGGALLDWTPTIITLISSCKSIIVYINRNNFFPTYMNVDVCLCVHIMLERGNEWVRR